jgi:hypothetical protein
MPCEKRGIQYAAPRMLNANFAEYWIVRVRGR